MMKDIFIDADIANTFANTEDQNKLDLINWLLNNECAFLVTSNSLRGEYFGGNAGCEKELSIAYIYTQLQKEERLNPIKIDKIKQFQQTHFEWESISCKRSGSHDPDHIAAIFLSDRRIALVKDGKFHSDLINFFPKKKVKGKRVTVATCPSKLNYKEDEAA